METRRDTGSKNGETTVKKGHGARVEPIGGSGGNDKNGVMSNGEGGGGGGGGIIHHGGLTKGVVAELSKRRFANDPAMMRELQRYQKLMLLTLLPSITSDADHTPAHPHSHAHNQDGTDTSPLTFRGQPDGASEVKDYSSDHLPRPEPTDGFAGVTQYSVAARRNSQQVKSAGNHGSHQAGRSLPTGPASAGTRLPMAVYNPLETSPRPKPRRKSHEDSITTPTRRRNRRKSQDEGNMSRRRRRSDGDDRQGLPGEDEEVPDIPGGASVPGGASAGNGGELDLLTLAALYLESRHRVFGQELHHRLDHPGNSRTVAAAVGATGVARPRRLTPLSPSKEPPSDSQKEEGDKGGLMNFSSVMPTPAGLHLSVNYTHNLGLDETTYLSERARALRPRLRRLNSMDDLLPEPPDASTGDLQKATSAPNLSVSAHGRRNNTLTNLSRVSSQDSLSPPLVTPARANTPTEAKHSAALVRPQMVGGSLATYSAVDTAKVRNISYGKGINILVGHSISTQPKQLSEASRSQPKHLPEVSLSHSLPIPDHSRSQSVQLPEASRTILQPHKLSYRPTRVPPDPRFKDLPRTPPPTASGEGVRKVGRVHLQPIVLKKSSL